MPGTQVTQPATSKHTKLIEQMLAIFMSLPQGQ